MKKIIVGVDPGTYVGIAIFDIKKNLIAAHTITNSGREKVVEEIIKYGTPTVVVTDVHTIPEFVIHIATYFNAKIYAPETNVGEQEKIALAHDYNYESQHERDAIAAVLRFFKQYENKFRWADKLIAEKGLGAYEESIKHSILAGVRISDSISALENLDLPPIKIKERKTEKTETGAKHADNEVVLGLLESNARLRSRLSILAAEKTALEARIKELKREYGMNVETRRLLDQKDMQIKRLKMLLQRKDSGMKKSDEIKKEIKKEEKEAPLNPDVEEIIEKYRTERMKKFSDYRQY